MMTARLRTKAGRRRQRRMTIETLERRRLLATIQVSPAVPDGEVGSLREALDRANQMTEAVTIELAEGVYELSKQGRYDDDNRSGDIDIRKEGGDLVLRGNGDVIVDGSADENTNPSAIASTPTLIRPAGPG